MKFIEENKALKCSYNFWKVHNTEKGYPEHYPDEEVVRFLMRLKGNAKKNKKKLKSIKVLDLASGCGKNSIPIAELGFNLFCLDYSKPGLDYTKKRLKKLNLSANFSCTDFIKNELPFPDNFFDAIISIQVFDHIFLNSVSRLLEETSRVLKKEGKMIASLMSKRTTKVTRIGIPVKNNKDSYIVSSGNSAGEIHSFFNEKKMSSVLKKRYVIDNSFLSEKIFDDSKEVEECKYFSLSNKS